MLDEHRRRELNGRLMNEMWEDESDWLGRETRHTEAIAASVIHSEKQDGAFDCRIVRKRDGRRNCSPISVV